MQELPWPFLFVMATLAITIVLPVILLVGFFDLRKRKLANRPASGNELTTGELDDIITASVQEATADLEHQLLRIDRRMSVIEKRIQEPGLLQMNDHEVHEKPEAEPLKSFGRLRS
jgi:hypothetical protein